MRPRTLAVALALGTMTMAAPPGGREAEAQSATTGAVQGAVKDSKTGEALAGVTVVVTGPALQGTQTAITDDNGFYKITDLPPGTYLVTFYYTDVTVERKNIVVGVNKVTPVFQKIDSSRSGGEVIEIRDTAPTIDATSTRQGITIDRNYIKNIPVPGRSFQTALGAAGGVQISGSTSVNQSTPPVSSQSADLGNNTEAYKRIDDNPFFHVRTAPMSTFSIDVDTASYANARRFLRAGELPPPDAVRVEELLNYFHYDYPQPASGQPFSLVTEVGPSPWNASYKLVRIGMHTADVAAAQVPPRNLVFLVDVSGSMEDENKLPLLVNALGLLTETLRPQDSIAIVAYADGTGVVLPATHGDAKLKIRQALASLHAQGSTNGGAGIQLAYQQARDHFIKNGINRVILCTDGDFNVGTTSEGDLTRMIEDERKANVFLTVLGFGMGNLKDATMESLADRGNGNYAYIDSIDEARKVLVKEAGGTLMTVAKDVKLQVEFNPANVAGYRLIGYEDRMLKDEDFNDDKKDAGEMGAGHSVTAMYEIVPAGMAVPGAKVDNLKYQVAVPTAPSPELLTVKIRYKAPTGDTSKLFTRPVLAATTPLDRTTVDFHWAAAVAEYGMMLRGSPERGSMTWVQVKALAQAGLGPDAEGYRRELLALIDTASKLKRKP